MSLSRRVSPIVSALLTNDTLRDLRRAAEARRRIGGQPHRAHYFHQVDDPYSHPNLVGPPPDDAAPERERLAAFARKQLTVLALLDRCAEAARGKQGTRK